jgi:hypothetical protein
VNSNNMFANDHAAAIGAHFATGHVLPLNADPYTDIRLNNGLGSCASLALPGADTDGDAQPKPKKRKRAAPKAV